LQDADSLYKCGERAEEWLKMKPDYLLCGKEEFDVLIVATSYGTGRTRGGRLWQYVCAVAEDSPAGQEPRVFRSFCRVGTGISREQHDRLEASTGPLQPALLFMPPKSTCSIRKLHTVAYTDAT
jgi:DNA ligase 4